MRSKTVGLALFASGKPGTRLAEYAALGADEHALYRRTINAYLKRGCSPPPSPRERWRSRKPGAFAQTETPAAGTVSQHE